MQKKKKKKSKLFYPSPTYATLQRMELFSSCTRLYKLGMSPWEDSGLLSRSYKFTQREHGKELPT